MPLWLIQTTILVAVAFLVGFVILIHLRQPKGWRRWLASGTVVGGGFLALAVACAADKARRAELALKERSTAIDLLDDLLAGLRDMETGQRGYLLTGQPDYLRPYQEAQGKVQEACARIGDITQQGALPAGQVANLLGLVETKTAELAHTVNLYQTEGREAALAVVQSHQGQRAMVDIRLAIQALQGEQGRAIRQTQAQELDELQRLGWAALALAVLSAAGFVSFAYMGNQGP